MGRPKALLEAGDRTFIRRILEALRDGGVADAVVVVRPGQASGDRGSRGVRIRADRRRTRAPDEGQLSSLIAGLDAIDRPGVDAVLVTLVDVPLIGADAVRAAAGARRRVRRPVSAPFTPGRHGHPVIFKRRSSTRCARADPAAGAKAVVRAVPVEDVEVGDPGVAEDVDTPEDYARLFGKTSGLLTSAPQPVIGATV